MDVRSRGDHSISLEIAVKGPHVATERLIKLIDQNLTVYTFLRFKTRDRNSDFICRSCLSFYNVYYLCKTARRIHI